MKSLRGWGSLCVLMVFLAALFFEIWILIQPFVPHDNKKHAIKKEDVADITTEAGEWEINSRYYRYRTMVRLINPEDTDGKDPEDYIYYFNNFKSSGEFMFNIDEETKTITQM